MYKFAFISDKGDRFDFDQTLGVFAEADFGKPVTVDISTSQGFQQIGVTAEKETVGSRTLLIRGVLRQMVTARKVQMRRIFAPFTHGKILFGEYEIACIVQDPPAFSTGNRDGAFIMRLLAPHPYWRKQTGQSQLVGTIEPLFSFPVNYAEPHIFGKRSDVRTVNIYNGGDVDAPFEIRIAADGGSIDPLISNIQTLEVVRLKGTLQAGDDLHLYQQDGIARAELTRGGEVLDVLSWIDESTNLFFLHPGDNLISVTDTTGAKNIAVTFRFAEEAVAVYEP